MTLPDPLSAYRSAPLADLLAILLRQYRRPLAGRGIDLSDSQAEALARAMADRADLGSRGAAIRAALADLVAESDAVLARWNLTFEQSLDTEMADIPGWQSTAEFLDIANQKANAELRISTGAALLLALGDPRYAPQLLFLVTRGETDLDAVIARRVLEFASGLDASDPDGLERLRAWVGHVQNPGAESKFRL